MRVESVEPPIRAAPGRLQTQHGGSLNNLSVPGMRQKCLSEANLRTIETRTLSASNLAALRHKDLSLKPAMSSKAYNNPNSLSAVAKASFEAKARKYFYQLTTGCQRLGCRNKFCASCESSLQLTPDLATIMAIQLASRTRTCFCKPIAECEDGPYLPRSVFNHSPLPESNHSTAATHSQSLQDHETGATSSGNTYNATTSAGDHNSRDGDVQTTASRGGIGGYMIGRSIWNSYGYAKSRPESSGGSDSRSRAHRLSSQESIRRPFLHSVFLSSPYKTLFEPNLSVANDSLTPRSQTKSPLPGPAVSVGRSASTEKGRSTEQQTKPMLGPSTVNTLSATIPAIGSDSVANIGVEVNINLSSGLHLDSQVSPTGNPNYNDFGSSHSPTSTHTPPHPFHTTHTNHTHDPSTVNRSLAQSKKWQSKSSVDIRRPATDTETSAAQAVWQMPVVNGNEHELEMLQMQHNNAMANGKSSSVGHTGESWPESEFEGRDTHPGERKGVGEDWAEGVVRGITPAEVQLKVDEPAKGGIENASSDTDEYDFQALPDEPEYIPGYTMDELEDVQELSLTHLSLPLLENAIEIYESTRDPSFLVNTIRTVFASPQCLGMSFRREGAQASVYDSGVELGDVRKAYILILSLEPRDTFHRPLCNALEIIIAQLAHTSLTSSTLSQLLVILEFPELNVPTYHETLVRQLCWVVCELPTSAAGTLRRWLSRLVPSHFTQYVEVFAQYVSVHFHAGQRPGKHVVAAVRSLQLLFEANELAERELFRRVVDPALFYNDAVCRKIDYKQEFQLWRKSHQMNVDADKEVKSLRIRVSSRSNQPRISLFDFPFIIDPAGKSRVMHLDAVVQMSQVFEDAFVHSAWVFQAQKILEDSDAQNIDVKGALKTATCPYLVLEIRREQLVHDTISQLSNRKMQDIKKPLKIKWVGSGEEGLDMGGVQKEFFQSVFENIFNVGVGMFTYCEETRLFWFNANSLESSKEYEMVGLLLGLAIYNGVILDVKLPLVLYKKLMGRDATLVDLKGLSPTLAKSMDVLLEWDGAQGDLEDIFCYNFQTMQDVYGTTKPIDLKPNGGDIPVTNDNRKEFVALYVDWLLNKSVAKQFESFSRGFHRMCGGKTLDLCIPEELELLICGSPELDFTALQENAMYDDGYTRDCVVIQWFWLLVEGFDEDKKKQLLNFVTGSDRVPINGLANMTFIIQRNGPDSDRLPTALTCFSRLLLPEYSTYAKLKDRISVAIENGKGFGLV